MKRGAILALALAACSPQQPAADNRAAPAPTTSTALEPKPEPAPPVPVASPSAAATLPPPLHGSWTADAARDCASDTELRVDVAADSVKFYESVARVTSVTQVDPHSWAIVATASGEGETWTKRFTLNLNEDGTMTRVERGSADLTYTRCPKAKP